METKVSSFVDATLPTSASVERVAQSAHEVIDRVAAQAGPVLDKARTTATQAAATVEAKASALGEWEKQRMESMREHVRQNPLSSIALALMAGMLLTRLSR
jgi:ElaB/YqjD/DUF883 family membrane-anchored ribosome-binding protein